MSPRAKQVTDQQVLEAAALVVGRLGSSRVTLAEVAAEAGLAAPTLSQRFGSKRGLLLALARHSSHGAGDFFTAARAIHGSPLEALISTLIEGCAAMADDPVALSNNLAFRQVDLSDPEFHQLVLAQARSLQQEICGLLDEAVAWGELTACSTDDLARVLRATYTGSMLAWTIVREGEVRDWVRRDLELVLRPYRNPA